MSSAALRELLAQAGEQSWAAAPRGDRREHSDDGEGRPEENGEGYTDDEGSFADEQEGSEGYEEEYYSDEDDGGEEETGLVVREPRPFAVNRPLPVDVWRARHESVEVVKEVRISGRCVRGRM